MNDYTTLELNFIRQHYPVKGPGFCAEKLNRKKNSVRQFAKKHGVRCLTKRQILALSA